MKNLISIRYGNEEAGITYEQKPYGLVFHTNGPAGEYGPVDLDTAIETVARSLAPEQPKHIQRIRLRLLADTRVRQMKLFIKWEGK